MKSLLFCISTFILLPCYYAQAQDKTEVIVLPLKMAPPAGAKKTGTIKAGNNATASHCDYEEVVNDAKEQAKKMGGNLVKITQLIPPAFISKCYKIQADVYFADPLPNYKITDNTENNAPRIIANYATLYFYRLKDTTLLLESSYSIHLNDDSVICRVKSKSRDSVRIYKEGPITLWARSEQRTELKLNVKLNEAYYIRCGLVKGEIKMIPVLQLISNEEGCKEFETHKKRKKDTGIAYLNQVH